MEEKRSPVASCNCGPWRVIGALGAIAMLVASVINTVVLATFIDRVYHTVEILSPREIPIVVSGEAKIVGSIPVDFSVTQLPPKVDQPAPPAAELPPPQVIPSPGSPHGYILAPGKTSKSQPKCQ